MESLLRIFGLWWRSQLHNLAVNAQVNTFCQWLSEALMISVYDSFLSNVISIVLFSFIVLISNHSSCSYWWVLGDPQFGHTVPNLNHHYLFIYLKIGRFLAAIKTEFLDWLRYCRVNGLRTRQNNDLFKSIIVLESPISLVTNR